MKEYKVTCTVTYYVKADLEEDAKNIYLSILESGAIDLCGHDKSELYNDINIDIEET